MDEFIAGRSIGHVRWYRFVVWTLLAVLVGSLFSGVAYGVSSLADASNPGTSPSAVSRSLRIGVSGQDAVTLNPNGITLSLEFVIVYNVYSTLITRDGHFDITGDLATKWEVSPDDLTWTFHLAPNAFFTDPKNPADRSHPVTASDVVFSYNMIIGQPDSYLNSYTSVITNVAALDSSTVQILVSEPYAAMNSTLAAIPIFPEYLWSSVADPVNTEPVGYEGLPVGSGAMYYDTNSALSSGPIILKRNPNFFGDAAYCRVSRPNEVRFILFTSSGTMVDDFGSGSSKLDAIWNIPAPSYVNAAALSKPGITRTAVEGGFVGEFAVNVMTDAQRASLVAAGNVQYQNGTNNQILATDLTVRKAIAMSVDRAAVVRYAYLGLATPGDTLVPKSNRWHYDIPASQKFTFDTAAARRLLNDAGWKYDSSGALNPGATPLYKAGATAPLIFRFYTPDSHSEFEPAIANITIWLRQAGIQTTDHRGNAVPGYVVKSENEMGSIWKAADYDLWVWDWIFSKVSDPSTDVLQVETTGSIPGLSDNWYSNVTYDALYNQSLVTPDVSARRALTDEMQRMLYFYASYNILYYANDLYAFTNSTNLGYGWENWGDWNADPGLVLDSDLPTLWFNLAPHDNPAPSILAFPSLTHVVGNSLRIGVVATDPNDNSLNYTWDFGDGSAKVTTTTSSVSHTYTQTGTFTISVRAEDAEFPACATTTATIGAAGTNAPPNAVLSYRFSGGVAHGLLNQAVPFSVNVSDSDGDPIYVTWTFGDGSTATNYVTGTSSPRAVTQTHTYAADGNFSFSVTATDNQSGGGHSKQLTATIPIWKSSISAGGGGGQLNPWINYGLPIALVLIVVAVAAVIVMRRRKAAETERREAQTEEPKSPPPPAP